MARMMVDCRDMPSDSNCTLAIAGDESRICSTQPSCTRARSTGTRTLQICGKPSAVGSSQPTRRWPSVVGLKFAV